MFREVWDDLCDKFKSTVGCTFQNPKILLACLEKEKCLVPDQRPSSPRIWIRSAAQRNEPLTRLIFLPRVNAPRSKLNECMSSSTPASSCSSCLLVPAPPAPAPPPPRRPPFPGPHYPDLHGPDPYRGPSRLSLQLRRSGGGGVA
jgi:hypothetical protein